MPYRATGRGNLRPAHSNSPDLHPTAHDRTEMCDVGYTAWVRRPAPTKEQHCLAWYKYILYAFAHGGIPVAGVEEFLWLAWVDWNGKRPHRAIGEIDNWLAPRSRGGSGRIVTQAGGGSTSRCRSAADRMRIGCRSEVRVTKALFFTSATSSR